MLCNWNVLERVTLERDKQLLIVAFQMWARVQVQLPEGGEEGYVAAMFDDTSDPSYDSGGVLPTRRTKPMRGTRGQG